MLSKLVTCVLAGAFVVACTESEPMNPTSDGARPESAANASEWNEPLVFERQGGLAGFDDRLTVRPDGRASLRSGGSPPGEFRIDPTELQELTGELTDHLALLRQAEGGAGVSADRLTYRISLGDRVLVCPSEELPEGLRRLVELLQAQLAKD